LLDYALEYLCADIASVPEPDAFVDAVVCYSPFPHFQDKSRCLLEISRLLKKGGKYFVAHSSSRLSINHVHSRRAVLSHDLVPENDEMERLLSLAGFSDIKIMDNADRYVVSARKT
jgi:ubiquinone/menaquinone biosynthesis C-methylase UbiE